MAGSRGRRHIFDNQSRYLDRFGLLLAVTALSIVVLALVSVYSVSDGLPSKLVSVAASAFVGLTMILALRAAGVASGWLRVVVGVVVVALLVLAAFTLLGPDSSLAHDDTPIPAPTLVMVLAAVAPVVVVRRLLRHERVTRETLFGAISAYLLIPITFFYAFLTVNAYSAAPFFGAEEPSQSYMYFSLTTIATVGYGDLTAKGDLGRLLANAEALIGQIYLVCIVAMIVGLLAQQWMVQRQSAKAETPSGQDSDAN